MKWTYNISGTFTKEGKEYDFLTQLYMVGVYMILNSDSSLQFNMEPKDMKKFIKDLKKDFKDGKIENLQLGREITIIEKDGLYEKVTS